MGKLPIHIKNNGRDGLAKCIATLSMLVLFVFQWARSEVVLTLLDSKNNPITGVTCSQNSSSSVVSDASGRMVFAQILSIAKQGATEKQHFSLSKIPLARGENAQLVVWNTRGEKVLSRTLSVGERIQFNRQDKGIYMVSIAGTQISYRGPLVNMGNKIVFEGVESANTQSLAKSAEAIALSASVVCSKTGYVTQVYRVTDGENLQIDFSKPKIIPLWDATTKLEPESHFDRGDAIITNWGDRARDRHAKEDQFQSYDHYLTHYWMHRTARTILTDKVTKGGNSIDVSWVTEWKLDNLPEFRAWYSGKGSVAQYYGNYAPLFKKEGPGLYDHNHTKISDNGNQYKYTYTIKTAITLDGKEVPLAVGQFMEIEASQFLETPPEGRDNYYGTTFLYEVGKGGLVPWYTVGTWADQTSERENSHKLPEFTWLGGRTTLPYQYSDEPDNHFMQMATNMAGDNAQSFVLGRRVLHTNFITGAHDEVDNPVWTENAGKGGPNYINTSCNSCHIRNGRGSSPVVNSALYNMVVKVGDASGSPHPKMGGVLQPQNTSGAVEGYAAIASWTETNGLRKANYSFAGGPIPTNYSVRATPQLVGMGLLEAVSETTIQGLEDPSDANGDGISGRINIISDPKSSEPRMGRFGWKAGKVDLTHQIAGAFNTDMGVMTSLLPKPDCGAEQTNCGSATSELADSSLQQLVTYIRLLGVRARRNFQDPVALQGEALFTSVGCTACHTQTLTTSPYHPNAELRNQTIHPYTDLLLHDMGPGLADNLPEGLATGAEWRTPPLWGIGLSACVTGGVVGPFQKQVCSPDANYLHDGRARTLEEAILWHGGEAVNAVNQYKALSPSEVTALIKFLNSL